MNPVIKPMLASDFEAKKVKFPVMVQPKIDGVRSINFTGQLTGRSLKKHKNKATTERFSDIKLMGLDGEMAVGGVTDENLCILTSSALSTIEGSPEVFWHIFDYFTSDTQYLPYHTRLLRLENRLQYLHEIDHPLANHLVRVPSVICFNMDEVLALEETILESGYEGVILRDPNGLYKQGRSTVKEGGLLRIKRFIEEDAEVVSLVEGTTNLNEAKTNELGYTERSSHQNNLKPNGLLGNLVCTLSKDVFDPVSGKHLLDAGVKIKVSPGNMTHEERGHYLRNPHLLIGRTIKFKLFPKGIKDKPRFPTFVSLRNNNDLIKEQS
jgi:DNA ligase 1